MAVDEILREIAVKRVSGLLLPPTSARVLASAFEFCSDTARGEISSRVKQDVGLSRVLDLKSGRRSPYYLSINVQLQWMGASFKHPKDAPQTGRNITAVTLGSLATVKFTQSRENVARSSDGLR